MLPGACWLLVERHLDGVRLALSAGPLLLVTRMRFMMLFSNGARSPSGFCVASPPPPWCSGSSSSSDAARAGDCVSCSSSPSACAMQHGCLFRSVGLHFFFFFFFFFNASSFTAGLHWDPCLRVFLEAVSEVRSIMSNEPAKKSSTGKLFIRGVISNSIAFGVLYGVSRIDGLALGVYVSLGIQMAVFLFHGLPFRSEKFYDLSGSLTHLAVVVAALASATRTRTARQLLLAIGSTVWLTRLGTFLFLRILRDGRDPRFDAIKTNALSFCGAWALQAAWVVLIQTPVLLLNARDDTAPLSAADGVAAAAWLVGFVVEATADVQKFAFRLPAENKEKFITTGLWRYSRHPNYFGELLMWAAMALAASEAGRVAGDVSLEFAWLSPTFTAFLLLCLSGVPMVEAAGRKKWGTDVGYLHYMKHTSLLVPWFPAAPLAGGNALLH